MYVSSIYRIDLSALQKKGVKSFIVDLDNTLVEASCEDATPQIMTWFKEIQALGLQVIVVSNNTKTRVSQFCHPLDVPFIYTAKKPLSLAFRKALKQLATQKHETVVVGDQLLTDVLGGNRMGLYTILVVPMSAEAEGFWTRINRKMERFFFRWMEKKGHLQWEDKH
jgi:uncharacterized protein